VVVHWRDVAAEDPGISSDPRCWLVGSGLVVVWLVLPLALIPGARRSDAHFVRTLEEVAERAGRPIELSRAHAYERPGADIAETLEGEVVTLDGLTVDGAQTISIRGVFLDQTTIRVDQWFVHARGARAGASYVGLAVVGLLWGRWARTRWIRRRAGPRRA
jgi:hypothetical protein